MQIKKKIYDCIAHSGIWMLSTFFPEHFAAEPLQPTDRYLEYPFILENLPKKRCKVLDVGCSGSMFPLLLKALGYETYGIDIREYYPEREFFFIQEDICISTLESEYFNTVTAISSIEHIGLRGRYGSEDIIDGDIKALKEIYRVLIPKGLLLMTVPYGTDLRIDRNHRIYTTDRLNTLLKDFSQYEFQLTDSPEADYMIAKIKAIK